MIGRADIEESKSNCNREGDKRMNVRMTVLHCDYVLLREASLCLLTVAMNAWLPQL